MIQTGQSISDVAWDNGVSERLLSKWVKLERERTGLPPDQSQEPLSSKERARIRHLERKNARLQQEVDFLKVANAYFAALHDHEGPTHK